MLGFCVNAAVIPLHAWLPDAYPEATVTGAVFMSAFTTKTAVYVLLRGFAGFEILAVMGILMTLYGVIYATIENNARRILAYHIVSQVGYMVAGVGVGTAMTINGACAHAYAHILYKGLLFMGAGCAALRGRHGQAHGTGRPVPAPAVGLRLVHGGGGEHLRLPAVLGVRQQDHDHHRRGRSPPHLARPGHGGRRGRHLPVGRHQAALLRLVRQTGPGMALKPIPRNMYAAMAIAGFLCFFIGVQPDFLYRLLPFPVEYVPYTAWHVLQTLLLLGFTGLGFYLLRLKLVPEAKLNLDCDYFYRLAGRTVLALARRPVEQLDNWWNEFYARAGLRGMIRLAGGSAWFDRAAIDGVVDGTAVNVRRAGKTATLAQTGQLQNYLAAAVLLALIVFAVVRFWG